MNDGSLKDKVRLNNIKVMDLALDNLKNEELISENAIMLIRRIRDDCIYSTKPGKIKFSTIKHFKDNYSEEFEDEKES